MTKWNIPGFRVTRTTPIKDCDGELVEFVYEKTNTRIAWLKREEENKTFAITFKTIPEDDTGVFHILEHSVLNGSKKYPVKEPFVNLLKGSMKTFLNAMTFPDKTMYPVSSRNAKDFLNLMSVYLDAVLNPLVKENTMIFAQEGWHYEIRDEKEEPIYKGVVFNEMKGAYGSVDEVIIDEASKILFPDNCYQYSSGGDPVKIPTLTYEQFKAAHDRFYHPSNATIFLDGDLDIEATLQMIDSYLQPYEELEISLEIPLQKEVIRKKEMEYEIGAEEDTKEKTQLAFSKITGDFKDVEQNIAWSILASVLVGNNESPLKKSILEKGLGQDVELYYLDGIQQPILLYLIRNTEKKHLDKIKEVTRNTIEELVHGGLNHNLIRAALNQAEFLYREKKEPSGIIFAQTIYMSWLYGGEPELYLDSGKYFSTLREKVEEGYFENLLKEVFLTDTLSEVVLTPSKTLGEKRNEEEKNRLHEISSGWSKEEKEAFISFNKALDEWQATPDSKKASATIPALAIEDIEKDPKHFEPEVLEYKNIPYLQYERQDTGIVYWHLYFNLAGMKIDQLPSVSLFTRLLTQLPTKSHSVQELQEIVQGNLGSLSFRVDTFSPDNRTDVATPLLVVACSFLEANADVARDIIFEILTETEYTKETVTPVVQQLIEAYRQSMLEGGHAIGMMHAGAQHSAAHAASEAMGGYTYCKWQSQLLKQEDQFQQFLEDTKQYQEILLTKDRLTVSITGQESEVEMKELVDRFPSQEFHRATVHYPLRKKANEAITIPSQVSYSALAMKLYEYEGALKVIGQISTFDYLWNEVRVKGGSYGTGMNIASNGIVTCYSYRDPDPSRSLKVYEGLADMIRNLNPTEEELTSYIIGTISNGEPLLSPNSKIALADARYFSGTTYEDRKQRRHEILATTKEDLIRLADVLEEGLKDATLCVIGTQEKTKELEGFEVESFS